MELSFEALRRVHAAEKTDSALQSLPVDFFEQYASILAQGKDALAANYSLDGHQKHENTAKILRDLADRRESKIVIKALRDARTGNVNADGLCKHETALYTSMVRACLDARENVNLLANGKTPAPSTTSSTASESTVVTQTTVTTTSTVSARKVFVLLDVPQFVSPTGSPVGPLKTGETVEMDGESAALMIRKGAARDA